LICPYSLTVPGGVQSQVLGLARELRRRGHEARVLAPCDGPPPDTFVLPMGNSIPTAANGSMAPLAPDPAAALRTIRALRDEDFDVLHLHEPIAPGPTLTALVLRSAPMVGTFHAAGDSNTYKYMTRQCRWAIERLDARCTVSKDAEDLIGGYLGGEYIRVFNGVEVERFRNAEPLKPDGPTIFFCGRHEPRKGLETLLAALRFLPSDVRCWVGSKGPDTERLKVEYAGDPRIEWLGFLSDDEKLARLRGAHVYCAPSNGGESFGVVLLEGMAAGCPVVAGDIPGYRNVATHEVNALLATPDDPEALADALRRVLEDAPLSESLRQGGLDRAAEFSMASLAARYEDIYASVRSRGRSLDEQSRGTGAVRRMMSRFALTPRELR
jgi:phosphatidyl-myo-inositol alpha-mannosyltransferase